MPTQNFVVGEMINKRTPNSKTWMNFDGSYTTEIYSGLIHFEDENGLLQNINTDLYDEADFDIIDEPISKASVEGFKQSRTVAKSAKSKNIMNRANYNFKSLRLPFEATIPRNFKRGYSIGNGANKLTFKPVNASPSMSELYENDRSKIVYQDVWNDTDVELKVNPDGIKETIFLKTEKAPTSFTFEVDGPLEDDLTSGELKLQPAWLVDANGTFKDVPQTIRRDGEKTYVDLVVDVTDLVYPIEVDPTVVLDYSKIQDTLLDQGNPSFAYGSAGEGEIGFDYGTQKIGLIKFDISSITPGSDVTSATMELCGFAATDGQNTTTIKIYEAAKAWVESTATWNNTASGITGSFVTENVVNRDNAYKSFNITVLVNAWVKGTKANNGMTIQTDNVKVYQYFHMYFKEYSDTTKRPKLTVIYNRIPTTPTVTAPNGGENWNSLHTITWNQSTDADGNPLTYEIQLSTNNGSTWKTIKSGVSGGSTTYDFINEVETSTAKIRIRAFDGQAYSGWDESNGVFTIQHNHAPNTPINLSPKGGVSLNRSQIIRLSWTHSDVNGDPQAKFDLQWRLQGSSTWTTVSNATPNQYFEATPNYFPKGTIEWRVRTYDQTNLISPYSNIEVFQSGEKPDAPTFVSPLNGEIVPFSKPTIQWSSTNQVGYHLKVLNTSNTLLWEEIVTTTNKAVTLSYTLANNTAYKLQLAVKNADNLYSDFVSITIDVSYTPPKKPLVSIANDSESGSITISINNPAPTGTEPILAYNDIYRRKQSETEFIRITTDIVEEYIDYAVSSGIGYEYLVRAVGVNGTYTDSDIIGGSVIFKYVKLHLASNPLESITLIFNGSRKFSTNFESARLQFAGRKRPLTDFGELIENELGLSYLLKPSDIHKFEELLYKRETMLYRDSRGRKLFVTAGNYSVNDELKFGNYEVELPLLEVDYTEEV